jgi:hypothetical protein
MDAPDPPEDRLTWVRYTLVSVVLVALGVAVAVSLPGKPEIETRPGIENTPGPAPTITDLPAVKTDRDLTVTIDSVQRVGTLVRVAYSYTLAPSAAPLQRLEVSCNRPDSDRVYTWEDQPAGAPLPGVTVARGLVDVPASLQALDIEVVGKLAPPLAAADLLFDVPLPAAGPSSVHLFTFPGGKALVNEIVVRPEEEIADSDLGVEVEHGFAIDLDLWLDQELSLGASDPAVVCTDTEGKALGGRLVQSLVTGAGRQYSVQIEIDGMAEPPPPMVTLHLFGRKTMDSYRRQVRFAGVAIGNENPPR